MTAGFLDGLFRMLTDPGDFVAEPSSSGDCSYGRGPDRHRPSQVSLFRINGAFSCRLFATRRKLCLRYHPRNCGQVNAEKPRGVSNALRQIS